MEDNNRNPPNEKPVSLAPLTPDQALAAALQVKKSDVDRLADKEEADKVKRAKKKK